MPNLFPPLAAVRQVAAEPTVDVEAVRAQAESEGYALGLAKGHREGLELGISEGRAAGYEDGVREAQEELEMAHLQAIQEFRQALQGKVDALDEEIGRYFDAVEERLTDLCMGALREMLRAELSLSRESALAIAREALREVTHARHARIRMNPLDVPALAQRRQELMAASPSLRDVELVEDPEILGGCVIESDAGEVDARLEHRLELIEGGLEEAA